MRRIISLFAIAIVALSSFAQISIGIRSNRFVNISYLYKDHYFARLEQSVFSEKPGLQYMRGYAGYETHISAFDLKGTAYFGSTFNRLYYSTGASVEARIRPIPFLIVDGRFNPHYDSGFGYTSCYYGGLGACITKHIDILVGYTNIPEYRMPEKRLNMGFDFHIKNLVVRPKFSLNLSSDSGPKSLRPIIDFEYTFPKKSRHE
ncbi:MAG: hypothetical protein K2H38_00600 [Muribaculaceae bacterium]|nr:hypothetical protein [Muribaculaceae bacterium]MDE6552865.1 hypothetical protein [Muribaculaceae bacterium]